MISIEVDSRAVKVAEGCTIKEALESLGFEIALHPAEKGLFMPCQTGGCWACAVDVDGSLAPACATSVSQGMRIMTGRERMTVPSIKEGADDIEKAGAPKEPISSCRSGSDLTPKRLVGGFLGHQAGGVGTPWWLKGGSIEVACFTAGCNLCCPQCQNWRFTYAGSLTSSSFGFQSSATSSTSDSAASLPSPPSQSLTTLLTPEQAARKMTAARRRFAVDRLAVSGGECTLNRPWLVEFLRLLRKMNPAAHLHVDTNGSILTRDYIDELAEAGMTDIGIDLKALRTATFMEICGLVDEPLAEMYLETAWRAVRYVHDSYPQIYLGVGIPYNSLLISLDEIIAMGRKIAEIDPWMQVCVLDLRPEFLRDDLIRPSFWDMMQVHYNLRDCGLLTVVCQTEKGKVGPSGRLVV